MSSSDSVKNERFVFRIDARIPSDEKSEIESWFEKNLKGRSQTVFALQSIRNQIQFEDHDGLVLPDDLLELVKKYCARFDVPPRPADVVRKAIENFIKEK